METHLFRPQLTNGNMMASIEDVMWGGTPPPCGRLVVRGYLRFRGDIGFAAHLYNRGNPVLRLSRNAHPEYAYSALLDEGAFLFVGLSENENGCNDITIAADGQTRATSVMTYFLAQTAGEIESIPKDK